MQLNPTTKDQILKSLTQLNCPDNYYELKERIRKNEYGFKQRARLTERKPLVKVEMK